jgi:hypothetical protein
VDPPSPHLPSFTLGPWIYAHPRHVPRRDQDPPNPLEKSRLPVWRKRQKKASAVLFMVQICSCGSRSARPNYSREGDSDEKEYEVERMRPTIREAGLLLENKAAGLRKGFLSILSYPLGFQVNFQSLSGKSPMKRYRGASLLLINSYREDVRK